MWGDHFLGVIYGRPQAMQRHRCAMHGRAYLPVETRKALIKIEKYVIAKMAEHGTEKIPRGVPVSAHIVFIHKKPKRVPQSYMPEWTQKKWKATTYRIMKTTKPDLDNLTKMILDGCTRGGLWADDSQIVQVNAYDFYAGERDEECVIFRISLQEKHMPKEKTGSS